jgi:hypothetical protein
MTRVAFDLALHVERNSVRVVLHAPPCGAAFGPLASSEVIPLDSGELYETLVASASHLVSTSTAWRGSRRAELMRPFRRRAAYLSARVEVGR